MTTSPATDALPAGVSRAFLLRHRICPRGIDSCGDLAVAVGVGACPLAVQELAALHRRSARTEIVDDAELEHLIERISNEAERIDALERVPEDREYDERTADVRDLANQPPVIRYVNLLIREAVASSASDIHLEASRSGLVARLRVDGVLTEAPEPPRQLQGAVVSRIKMIAELDIAERRRPQDGRIRVRVIERELDLRVSTIPTMHGESVVLRLLDREAVPAALDALGVPPELTVRLRRVLARPHGMLLVTGPTGSGKTSTLYAALRERDARQEKIITVEDPVEYELEGVTQVPVQRQAGMTFATALRAILRQDPDVVLVGEMRDGETAEIAVQAAMTGHLVLSTLHTNDALGAIPRLLDLGVADYLLAGTLEGVVAQRLVRRICRDCREPAMVDGSIAARLAARPMHEAVAFRGRGCPRCRGTGYRGRTGVFELIRVSDPVRSVIARSGGREELEDAARQDGLRTMREHGWELVIQGITTAEEVVRVLQD